MTILFIKDIFQITNEVKEVTMFKQKINLGKSIICAMHFHCLNF